LAHRISAFSNRTIIVVGAEWDPNLLEYQGISKLADSVLRRGIRHRDFIGHWDSE
jgi:hypothetical protein